MIIKPRWYQTPLIDDTYQAWSDGYRNVGLIAPCGSGKTYTMGFICREFNNRNQYVVVVAHRNVLLSQISLSFASLGIRHDLICNESTRRFIGDLHTEELGQCFISKTSKVCIASIGKLNNTNTTSFESKVGLWMMDETHHLLKENQWGRGVAKFTNAYGLGVTATFYRLDRKGLGSIADGVFDKIVQGVTAHDLIQSGDLSSYRVVRTPLSKQVHRDMSLVSSSGGEYNFKETKKTLARKDIVGDVVGTYIKHAMGLRGITFCQDIDACIKQAAAYNERGVPAIALSAKTPDKERWQGIKDFKSGKILQLVNCNLFGEGFDVPACFCASFVNPTKSYGKFTQEFFRPLRKLEGKEYAWIFDHVGNIEEHGLPDHGLVWEDYLDRPPKGRKRSTNNENALKLTTCTNPNCQSDYELPASACPWCGELYAVAGRGALKVVDGELVEMTKAEMDELRGKAKYITKSVDDIREKVERNHTTWGVAKKILEAHANQQATNIKLKKVIEEWSLKVWETGATLEQGRAQFAQLFQCDVLTAMTLSKKDAEKLIERIAL